MTRDEAFKLLEEMIQNNNLRKHGLAVEAIMLELCDYLKAKHPTLPESEFDRNEWGIVGLLHDADYELVEKDPTRHTLLTEEKLRPLGVSDRVINGIKAHHDGIKEGRDNYLEKAVYAADDISGFLTAVALVRPDKKLESVTVDSALKKFNQKEFAKGAKREQILACEKELDIPLDKYIELSLKAMNKISDKLGL